MGWADGRRCGTIISMADWGNHLSILQTGFKHVPHPHCHYVFFSYDFICHTCTIVFHILLCFSHVQKPFPTFHDFQWFSYVPLKWHVHHLSTIWHSPPYSVHRFFYPVSIDFLHQLHHFPRAFPGSHPTLDIKTDQPSPGPSIATPSGNDEHSLLLKQTGPSLTYSS